MARRERILVVDDEAPVVELLQDILAEEGYEIDTAGNGTEAISRLRTEHYDLVLTDFMMPGKTGIDVVKEIRSLGLRVPVLVLTASALEDQERMLRHLGVYKLLPKPVRMDELYEAVDGGLQNRWEERREVGRLPVKVPCSLVAGSTIISGTTASVSVKGLSFRPDDDIGSLSPETPDLAVEISSWNLDIPVTAKHLFQDPEGNVTVGLQYSDPASDVVDRLKSRLIEIQLDGDE